MLYVASGVSRDNHLLECSVGRDWDKPRNIVSVPPKSGRLATMRMSPSGFPTFMTVQDAPSHQRAHVTLPCFVRSLVQAVVRDGGGDGCVLLSRGRSHGFRTMMEEEANAVAGKVYRILCIRIG